MSDKKSLQRHSISNLVIIINESKKGGNLKLHQMAAEVLAEKEAARRLAESMATNMADFKNRPLWV